MATQKEQQQEAGRNQLAVLKRTVVDVVQGRVQQLVKAGQFNLPANYSQGNAIASWWLALQSTVDKDGKPALEVCTQNSVANATLDMLVQGLNPAKKQCYPVVYGKTLVCQRSYFGDEALLRRAYPEVTDVRAEVIYKGDEVEWEIQAGKRRVGKHTQKESAVGGLDSITGVYCVIMAGDQMLACERMTIDMVVSSWKKSKTYKKGGTSFHNEQPEEACKRTVIRRACKRLINASDDAYLLENLERHAIETTEAAMEADMLDDLEDGDILELPTHQEGETMPQAAEPEPVAAKATKDSDAPGLAF